MNIPKAGLEEALLEVCLGGEGTVARLRQKSGCESGCDGGQIIVVDGSWSAGLVFPAAAAHCLLARVATCLELTAWHRARAFECPRSEDPSQLVYRFVPPFG